MANRMKGSGREAFERRRAAITAAVHGGEPLRSIYDKYADELGVSYSWFTRCVRALVGKVEPVTSAKRKPVRYQRRTTNNAIRSTEFKPAVERRGDADELFRK